MAAKRRAASAKSSKLQAKKRNARFKKKIKDAQVRRAMRIYDDYTEELEKAQHMHPTKPKPKYTGKKSRKKTFNTNGRKITRRYNPLSTSPRILREAYDLALRTVELDASQPTGKQRTRAHDNFHSRTGETSSNETDIEKHLEEQDKEDMRQLHLEKTRAAELYDQILERQETNKLHVPIETVEIKAELKPRPPPWDLRNTSFEHWPEKSMSRRVSKYVQHHLVDVAENQRKLNEKRKPGFGLANFEAGVEENLATITEETVKNMIDSKYYNASDAELPHHGGDSLSGIGEDTLPITLTGDHCEDTPLTPHAPTVQRKHSHRKLFEHLQRETVSQGMSPLAKFRSSMAPRGN